MSEVLLVGSGNIGRRHFQGLLESRKVRKIAVVEICSSARNTLTRDFGERPAGKSLSVVSCLGEVKTQPELAIVATDSRPRAELTLELLNRTVPFIVLEKFLFSDLRDYETLDLALSKGGPSVWVNCPRRIYPQAQRLATQYRGKVHHYSVRGAEWGFCTNAIHYFDHWMWLQGPDRPPIQNVTIQTYGLPFPAKRTGYLEVHGKLEAQCGASKFVARCRPGLKHSLRLELFSGLEIEIDEQTQSMLENSKLREYVVPFQSQLTAPLVDSILESGDCGLTPYQESSEYHQLFLRSLMAALPDHSFRTSTGWPVT